MTFILVMNGDFDGEKLSLTGFGFFRMDDDLGRYVLQPDSVATHIIRLEIAANVVDTAPIPAGFNQFLNGLGLLASYRQGKCKS
jgi:hypothetical protein